MSKSTIQRKQNKKLMRKIKKQLGLKIAERQFDHRRLSPFGGYIDVVNFSHILGLQDSIVRKFQPDKSKHRLYSDADILQRLLDITILGVDRIDNSDLLYHDTLIQQLRGLSRDPSPSTLRRELEDCYAKDIADLEQINADFLESQSKLSSPQEVTLLIDLTNNNSYGHQQHAVPGFNHRETKRCFQSFLGTIQETQDIIKVDLKPGNFVPSAKDVIRFIKRCLSLVPSHLKVVSVRLDSGFWSFPVINLLEEKGLEYFVKGCLRNNTPLADLPYQIPEENWIRIPKINIWVSHKIDYYSSDYKKTYPLVFIRERVKNSNRKQKELDLGPFYSYRPLFSDSKKSPVKIYQTYNKGALVEDVIKEMKYEFFLGHIASHKFKANQAFIKIKVIAYNLINAFKRMILQGLWATKSSKAIRSWIIKTPCIVSSRGKGMKLIYSDNLKLRNFLNSISDKVWQTAVEAVS